MTIDRMIELLKIERDCMLRAAHDDCDRNCADCELAQDDYELDEMYINVISLLMEQQKIVRCKYCRFYEPDKYAPGEGDCNGACDNLVKVSDDWFCADGVKRDN